MRSLLAVGILCVLATAPPAAACPAGALCVIGDAPREESPPPQRPLTLRIERIAERVRWNLREPPPERPAVEMPWIWQLLRREVYARMPRYRDDKLTFVLAPVVVAGTYDTVPGLGLAGDF